MVKEIRGNGSIYKTKGIWVCEIRYVNEEDKIKRKVFRNSSKSVVLKLRDEFFESSKHKSCEFSFSAVKDFFALYIETTSKGIIRDSSYLRKKSTFENQIIPYLGEIRMCELTTLKVQQCVNSLAEKNYSASTIKKAIDIINSAVEYYRCLGGECCYSKKMITYRKSEKEPAFFNSAEMKIIEDFLWNHSGYRYSYALIILLNTGMRIGELLALERTDVDIEKGELMITKSVSEIGLDNNEISYRTNTGLTKTKSGRRAILLNSSARRAISSLLERDKEIESNWLICSKTGRQVYHGRINQFFHFVLDKIGIKKEGKIGVHSFRHSFATEMMANGVSSEALAVYLGHSNDRITKKYYVHNKNEIANNELLKSGLFE